MKIQYINKELFLLLTKFSAKPKNPIRSTVNPNHSTSAISFGHTTKVRTISEKQTDRFIIYFFTGLLVAGIQEFPIYFHWKRA